MIPRVTHGQGTRKLNFKFIIMSQDNLIKFKCEVCKSVNYHSTRNKKKIKEKISLKKYCKQCRKHTLHKEAK